MRTKQIIMGLNNTQKFRAIINGVFIGDCQVKDLTGNRFPHQVQRVAVWEALMEVARSRRVGANQIGFAGNRQGIDVQVDLV
jgi:UDP-N-acetyl-D-mannosaminuronic acid transferase (WecB/TagA/CpsF family)